MSDARFVTTFLLLAGSFLAGALHGIAAGDWWPFAANAALAALLWFAASRILRRLLRPVFLDVRQVHRRAHRPGPVQLPRVMADETPFDPRPPWRVNSPRPESDEDRMADLHMPLSSWSWKH